MLLFQILALYGIPVLYTPTIVFYLVAISRLTVVSRGATEEEAGLKDERVSYLQVAPL